MEENGREWNGNGMEWNEMRCKCNRKHKCKCKYKFHACMHACMDGWMDGWMGGCVNAYERLDPFDRQELALTEFDVSRRCKLAQYPKLAGLGRGSEAQDLPPQKKSPVRVGSLRTSRHSALLPTQVGRAGGLFGAAHSTILHTAGRYCIWRAPTQPSSDRQPTPSDTVGRAYAAMLARLGSSYHEFGQAGPS